MNLFVGDCKPSEVKAFIADYLEKVLEPCDWLALWSTDVFSVVLEVSPVGFTNAQKKKKEGCCLHECQNPKSPKNKKKCSNVNEISIILSSVIWCDVRANIQH